MDMDFSTFDSNSKAKTSGYEQQTVQNFSRAAVTALVMKAVVEANLIIPKTLFAAASASDAELNDGDWEWSYSKNAGGNSYGVRLVASRVNDSTVEWNAYVTNSQLGLEDRLFFSGTSNNEATEGEWTYYSLQSSQAEQEVSRINWSVNGTDDVDLELEILSDHNGYQGDTISYTFDGTVKHATYYDSSDDAAVEIELNVETMAGYIIAPNYNGGDQSCWNGDFQDVACSEI